MGTDICVTRRAMLGGLLTMAGAVTLAGLGAPRLAPAGETTAELAPLPPASPNPDDMFGVDLNINMGTIDGYLGRPDVVYRDMRLIFDPARWEDLDGDPYASQVLPGFKLVPFPYLATMAPVPVTEYYQGETLFACTWDEDSRLTNVKSNYKESMKLLRELFPQDKAIFLCCGGAGYASFTKQLLLYLGWDPSLVYNVGGMWNYEGDQAIRLIEYGVDESDDTYALWRADYALIDFTLLRPESVRYLDKREDA